MAKKNNTKYVAVIGAGLQAKRRLPAILHTPQYKIAWIVDIVPEKAQELAVQYGAQYETNWHKAVSDKKIDAVLVLTYPDSHAAISIAAMKNGKDVFCEKPLAKTEDEVLAMVQTAKKNRRILKCGFNHRYHPAIAAAYKLFKEQCVIGKPIFGRAKYGIAGRQGLEKEWRSDPGIVGGGQLMEQGIHLIDLYRWFLGEIKEVVGFADTAYWNIKPLEDNAFALLRTKDMVPISIHSSLTQWINTFEFELYGEKGSLTVQGLGSSYGVEKLTIGFRDLQGSFAYKVIEYRGADSSWQNEWEGFIEAMKTRKEPMGNGWDGLRAIKIVYAIYKSSKARRIIEIE